MAPIEPNLREEFVRRAVDATVRSFGLGLGDVAPSYGTPLRTAVEFDPDGLGPGWDWLESAVRAGHVPHLDGIVVALHASDGFLHQELRDTAPRDRAGVVARRAAAYRQIADIAIELASRLERS